MLELLAPCVSFSSRTGRSLGAMASPCMCRLLLPQQRVRDAHHLPLPCVSDSTVVLTLFRDRTGTHPCIEKKSFQPHTLSMAYFLVSTSTLRAKQSCHQIHAQLITSQPCGCAKCRCGTDGPACPTRRPQHGLSHSVKQPLELMDSNRHATRLIYPSSNNCIPIKSLFTLSCANGTGIIASCLAQGRDTPLSRHQRVLSSH